MLEDWTIYSWYCPNCKTQVVGLKNKKNQSCFLGIRVQGHLQHQGCAGSHCKQGKGMAARAWHESLSGGMIIPPLICLKIIEASSYNN